MYLLLLLAIGASTASPLGVPGHTYECITLPYPDCCSYHRFRLCVPGTFPLRSMVPSFAISPRTMLKSTVSPTCANGLSHFLPLSGPRTATIIRVPDKPRQNDSLAVNLVAKFLQRSS